MKKTLLTALFITSFSLTGCSTLNSLIEKPDAEKSVEDFYSAATLAFKNKEWDVAIDNYEKLKAYFPYGSYAEQSYLELAYAYYKYDEPKSAIRELEEFIRLYPRHKEMPYAYYLRALAADSVTRSWLDKFITDPATRDKVSAENAYNFYSELINRFPQSRYATAASERLIALRNQMARNELKVARFYYSKQAFLASANRAEYILQNYPRAVVTAEALELLTDSYQKMGMDVNESHAREVYQLNQGRLQSN
ncbi:MULTISPECIES: outer membrane protein assembly factor BamD [Thiomicrorhabdus]|uniref:Outer membrane protein assembly factor BamD n=1 Tax=Thiomicrorhabdus heinhorstiae TaxID=2748010 RepID=A0ABS0BXD5_9GAMM|nr:MULTISPECIES: outer membrane protein assembly factor BamD [Thiomicrorhabdus]MBF6058458.1 outer membrane protein assembly factor BamD [Thiomicrorhabdus heinhorstiae]